MAAPEPRLTPDNTMEWKMSDVDELVEWLRAQLDEDETLLRAATPGRWYAIPDHKDSIETRPLHVVAYENTTPEEMFQTGGQWVASAAEWQPEAVQNARHIARWDPARVLAEIAATRRILELHKPVLVNFNDHACTECGNSPLDGPCRTLRLLALPYADRPGYRDEWRPT